METNWTDEYFRVVLFACWIPAIGFPLVYGLTAKWWKSLIGRALETKATAMMFLVTLTNLFNLLGPNYYGRDTLKVVGASLLFVGMWSQFIAICKAKYEQRRDLRDPLIRDEDVRHDV